MSHLNESDIQRKICMKLAYERCGNYINAARAILHFSEEDKEGQDCSFQNLWHVLDLMATEIGSLAGMLDREILVEERDEQPAEF